MKICGKVGLKTHPFGATSANGDRISVKFQSYQSSSFNPHPKTHTVLYFNTYNTFCHVSGAVGSAHTYARWHACLMEWQLSASPWQSLLLSNTYKHAQERKLVPFLCAMTCFIEIYSELFIVIPIFYFLLNKTMTVLIANSGSQ